MVVDNIGMLHSGERYPREQLQSVDDVWRMGINLGCSCHFYPALAYPEFEYTMFADDDFLPGPRCLETLVARGESLYKYGDGFATLGETGRIFNLDSPSGKKYSGRSIAQTFPGGLGQVDITCRGSLVKTEDIPCIFPFRQLLINKFGQEAIELTRIHDDFLLCLGIQMAHGLKSFMVSSPPAQEERLFAVELDTQNDGLWKRPNHFQERNRMVEMALQVGWRRVQ